MYLVINNVTGEEIACNNLNKARYILTRAVERAESVYIAKERGYHYRELTVSKTTVSKVMSIKRNSQ